MKINTKLGAIRLDVNGAIKAENQDELMLKGLKYILFHEAPAIAYKKGSGFERNESYSEGLEKQVNAAVRESMEKCFSDIQIVSGRWVKPVDKVDAAVSAERKALYNSLKGIVDDNILGEKFPEFVEHSNGTEAVE